MNAKVVPVPMEEKLLAALDRVSKLQGRPRADIIREACRLYLHEVDTKQAEDEYIRGYQRLPETPDLGEAQVALLGEVLQAEDW